METSYGLDDQGSNPGRGKIPLSALTRGYFFGERGEGAGS
jgi:hypothetical protein